MRPFYLLCLLFSLAPHCASAAKEQAVIDAHDMRYDQANEIVHASGEVEIHYDQKILKADQVEYHMKDDTVTATGHVVLQEPSGTRSYADSMKLADKFSKGIAARFRTEFPNRSHLSSSKAKRLNEKHFEFTNSIYSACGSCETDSKTPLPWQLRASKSTMDLQSERVTHKNMWLDAYGVPIFYTPYFAHPSPGAKPKSGFLLPKYGSSRENGSLLELPLYLRIADNIDATITPTIYTKEHPLFKAEYRHLLPNGTIYTTGSLILPKQRSYAANAPLLPATRGHIFAKGDFISPHHWHTGFDIRRSSDPTYVKKFHFSDEVFLKSQLYANHFQDHRFLGTRIMDFQGLRDSDVAANMPIAIPYLQYRIENDPYTPHDARLSLASNMLMVYRKEGLNTRRFSTKLRWEKSYISDAGILFNWQNGIRLDGYQMEHAHAPSSLPSEHHDATHGRVIPFTSLTLRAPMRTYLASRPITVEPIVAIYASPRVKADFKEFNQDTVLVELTPENLFQDSRFLGQDLVETGIRSSYGMRSLFYNSEGIGGSVLVGQHYHREDPLLYQKGSGLDQKFSDYVGQVHLKPHKQLDVLYRVRVSKEDGSVKSSQLTTGFYFHPFSYHMTYTGLFDERQVKNPDVKYLTNTLGVAFKKGWKLEAGSEINLGQSEHLAKRMVKYFSKLSYNEDCYQVSALYRRDFVHDRDVVPQTFIGVSINLRTLNYDD